MVFSTATQRCDGTSHQHTLCKCNQWGAVVVTHIPGVYTSSMVSDSTTAYSAP